MMMNEARIHKIEKALNEGRNPPVEVGRELLGEIKEMREELLAWLERRNSLSSFSARHNLSSAQWASELALRCEPLRDYCEKLFSPSEAHHPNQSQIEELKREFAPQSARS